MTDLDATGGEPAEDLVPVRLPQQRHRGDQHTAHLAQQGGGGLHDQPAPQGQVLVVGDLLEPLLGQQLAQAAAETPGSYRVLSGIRSSSSRAALDLPAPNAPFTQMITVPPSP